MDLAAISAARSALCAAIALALSTELEESMEPTVPCISRPTIPALALPTFAHIFIFSTSVREWLSTSPVAKR